MDKDRLIREIECNFNDMKDALINNNAFDIIPLFRDYTDEIIKLINKENAYGK